LKESKEGLHKFESEATQAIRVGNHNFGDMAVEYAFQKGFKARGAGARGRRVGGLSCLSNTVGML